MSLKKIFYVSAAMLAAVFSVSLTSCDDNNDPEVPGLVCDPAEVEVLVGNSATVTVDGGSEPYTVASDDEAIATAVVDENTVTITGVAEGTATITVTDAAQLSGVITVKVATPGLEFDKSALSINIDSEETVTISGGEKPYTATVENTEIATAVVEDDIITVKGLKAGTTEITVTDKNTKTGTISVTIE